MAVKTYSVENLVIDRVQGSEREIVAEWKFGGSANNKEPRKNLDSFKYAWWYKSTVNGKERWIEAESGDKTWDPFVTRLTQSFTPPDNAVTIQFRIVPVSKTYEKETGTGKNKKTVEYNYWNSKEAHAYFDFYQSPVQVKKVTSMELTEQVTESGLAIRAHWEWNTNSLNPANCDGWAYEFRKYKDGIWQDGETGERVYDGPSALYPSSGNLEAGVKKVKFNVTPIPRGSLFVGGKPKWEEINLYPEPRRVSNVWLYYVKMTNNTYTFDWIMSKPITGITGFECQYQYYVGTSTSGSWLPVTPTSSTVDVGTSITKDVYVGNGAGGSPGEVTGGITTVNTSVWSYTFEPDSSASKVRCRVKPVSTVDGTLYNEEWSAWYPIDITPKPRAVKNIQLAFVPRTKSNLKATWQLSNTKDVASFAYEWQYSTVPGISSGNWIAGQSGSVNFSDFSDTWNCVYSFPDEAKKARFRVKVVPVYERSFSGEFTEWQYFVPNIPEVTLSNVRLDIFDASVGSLRARWNAYTTYEVNAYEYIWKYQTATLQSGNSWVEGGTGTTKNTYFDITPSDNVTSIKFSVKPNAKYASEFTGAYGSAVSFDFSSIKTRELKDIELRFTPGQDRKVDATWAVKNNNETNVTGFDYIWTYSIVNDSRTAWRYPGGNGTVDITNDRVSPHRWIAQFDFPSNASKVFFRVKPNPASALAFVGDYTEEYEWKWKQTSGKVYGVKILPYSDLTDRKVYATWRPLDTSGSSDMDVDSYTCEWSYYYQDRYWPGETKTSDPITCATEYEFPSNATEVKVVVTPIPKYEHQFYGQPSNAAKFTVEAETVVIDDEDITLRRLSDDTRTLVVSWNSSEEEWGYTPDSYSVEWDYVRNGVHFTQTNSVDGEATYLQDSYDSPSEAEIVYVRVRPVFDNNPIRVGEWSSNDHKYYEWSPDTVEVEDVSLSLQRGTDRTVVATWKIPAHVGLASFDYIWRYIVNGVRFEGNSGSVSGDTPACTYDAPDNCQAVDFRVKAVPAAESYFVGDYTAEETFSVPENITPETPSTPSVSINGFNLLATLDTYDTKTAQIEFEVVDEDSVISETGFAPTDVILNRASMMTGVSVGHAYRVRARGINSRGEYGEWSQYSTDVYTIPDRISGTITVETTSSSSVRLTWKVPKGIYVGGDTSTNRATIEKTTKLRYFDTAPDQVSNTQIDYLRESATATAEITQIDSSEDGHWYFRIKSTNSTGDSEWSNVVSAVLGTTPDAPTTWSSTMTATTDRDVFLFWVHNSEDKSAEKSAQLYLDVNGTTSTVTIPKETGDDTTSSYLITAGTYPVGAKIRWKVRTKGVTNEYGEWSVTRQVEIYAPPTLSIAFTSGVTRNQMTRFPLGFRVNAGPSSQTPIAYSVSVVSNSSYDGRDDSGTLKPVVVGETIFSKYYVSNNRTQTFTITPGEINLAAGMNYILNVTASMDSGLSVTSSMSFRTMWSDTDYYINAGIGYTESTIAAYITPYCTDENDGLISDVTLSVYRREFDGSLTLVMDEIPNDRTTTVIDPHPALDYARYRVVAKSTFNGNIDFVDLTPYPIGETAIVLQWNEQWTSFEGGEYVGSLVDEPHSGSFLKLPYNVKISDSNSIDSQLVEYIGRKHPVSYYGTQVGQKLTLNADIPLTDTETILALRRLAVWMGDVYVREPSGSGYWSRVDVSFSQTRVETVIPVTIEVTRVEGGV